MKCPECGGSGGIPTMPDGEPEMCRKCDGTGEVDKIRIPELIQIDELMSKCGYSYSSETNINNGYNCRESDQEEFEMIGNKKIGKCYAWSCPLAPLADLQDLKEFDEILYNEYKNSGDDQGCIESDWVIYLPEE